MRLVSLTVLVCLAAPGVAATAPGPGDGQAQTGSLDRVAEAYNQFLRGRHLENADDIDGAIAAFKRASELDPTAADVVAELAGLYLRQNRLADAIRTAEQALVIAPANREAHRVLGIVYATLAEGGRRARPRTGTAATAQRENIARAIPHLEQALDQPPAGSDPNVRATLARLYVVDGSFDKAIQLLTDLVNQEPGWNDGPRLLIEAFAGAGRNDEAIAWLERTAPDDPDLYPVLADLYERQRRPRDAAAAYEQAVKAGRDNPELRSRYASVLLAIGDRQALERARELLGDALAAQPDDTRALYLLSQAQRRLGDLSAAEATARQLIAESSRSPMGYYALAAALEERRQYQAVVNTLAPAIAEFRARPGASPAEVRLLLPHLGFAYQELGEYERAIDTFEEARQLSPDDTAVWAYLIQANLAAKRYDIVVEQSRQAVEQHPDDLRFARLRAQGLRQTGKIDDGVALLREFVTKRPDDPAPYVALADLYSEVDRGQEAVTVLREAQARFPDETSIPFELGAVLERQKRYRDAESAFLLVLAKDPDHAAALNYLGYMLADRGERLDQSIAYLKRAVAMEPENGSFLDSLGWAYFKSDQLDLALDLLQRAADQMKTNSVIQDHYGDALFKTGRYDDAIAAWERALRGDGDSIDSGVIDRKILAARQKLGDR
jgi:tetratricopeptide (TPR) repeat protein